MTTFAIEYRYAPDSELITEIRPQHREFLGALKAEGTLIGSGPYLDGDGGALIVIRLADSATVDDAIALMDQDPFHTAGALDGRVFHTWNPVLNVFGD
ncbi:MAG: YciI family protein [Corynebacterium sp.]|uniref:YciI family protein n=1 Tax=Corynebacterium sp. TaxID=1720 RepID=UPI0026DDA8C2|nr:YciI family protein [Corynebacterium sp.]MDO4760761.1 YciI family protein [Corynebacterium sp.]